MVPFIPVLTGAPTFNVRVPFFLNEDLNEHFLSSIKDLEVVHLSTAKKLPFEQSSHVFWFLACDFFLEVYKTKWPQQGGGHVLEQKKVRQQNVSSDGFS